jgi:Family of unknown function (DUF5760)
MESESEISVADLKTMVREWVRIDNQIRGISKQLSEHRSEKKKMSEMLVKVMRDNKLGQFDLKDGQIMYVKKNVKKPITQKQLLGILGNYFQGNEEKAAEMSTYIMSNREETVKESIKRVIAKAPSLEEVTDA